MVRTADARSRAALLLSACGSERRQRAEVRAATSRARIHGRPASRARGPAELLQRGGVRRSGGVHAFTRDSDRRPRSTCMSQRGGDREALGGGRDQRLRHRRSHRCLRPADDREGPARGARPLEDAELRQHRPVYKNQPWDPNNEHSVCKDWGSTGWCRQEPDLTPIVTWNDFMTSP